MMSRWGLQRRFQRRKSASRARWQPGRVALLGPVLFGVTALGLAGCGSSNGGSGGQSPTNSILRIGTDSGIDSINPFVALNTDSYTIFEYMYPQLDKYGSSLQIVPSFAKSWAVTGAGKVWTFKTQAGAKWSDGQPLTAADAAWTLSTIIKFQNSSAANLASGVTHMLSAKAPNATTLVLTYSKPVANVLSQLQPISILPEHIWAKYAAGKGAGLKTFANPVPIVSGGPFELFKYVPKSTAFFRANPHWWGPKPHIAGFGLQTFSDDDSMIRALETNQIDAVEIVPPTAYSAVKRANFVISSSPGLQLNYFSINSNQKMTAHRELLNPLVREALNVGVNRAQIDKVAYLGFARPAGNVIVPASGGWSDPALTAPAYNPTLANSLLDRAGFRKGPNGIRMAGGRPMSYTMVLYPTGGPEERIYQIIQTDYQQLGIHLTALALDSAAATTAVTGNNNTYKTFQLQFSQWQPGVDPDFQLSVFLCSQWGGWNDSGYCNPTYDRLYAQQGTTVDPGARRAIVWRMEQILAKDLPYIDLNYPNWIEAHSRHWTGFQMSPQGSFNQLSDSTLLSVRPVG